MRKAENDWLDHIKQLSKLLVLLWASGLSQGAGYNTAFADDKNTYWLHGSWVNLRSEPNRTAAIQGNLTANTPVLVEKRSDSWCLVRSKNKDAGKASDKNSDTGYVPCNLIGTAPLTLKQLTGADVPSENALPRAFWVAPSVRRFVAYGRFLNAWMLNDEQRAKQERTQAPVRFVVPEFEAMKKELVQAARNDLPNLDNELRRFKARTLQPISENSDQYIPPANELQEWLETFNLKSILPPAKKSLFERHSQALVGAEANPDTLMALSKKPATISFTGKPAWLNGAARSIWDIRSVQVNYGAPLFAHPITASGSLGLIQINANTVTQDADEAGCQLGYPALPSGSVSSAYAKLKELKDPLLVLYVATALDNKKLEVIKQKLNLTVSDNPERRNERAKARNVNLYHIDLNQDKYADVAVLEWSELGTVSGEQHLARLVFLNIAGEWWFVDYQAFNECAC